MASRREITAEIAILNEFVKVLDVRQKDLETRRPRSTYTMPNTLRGLLSFGKPPPVTKQEHVEVFTSDILDHKAYKSLSQRSSFRRAMTLFKARRVGEPDLLEGAIAQVKFLRSVVAALNHILGASSFGLMPRSVSTAERRAAAKHALSLLSSIDSGVLKGWSSADTLRGLLLELSTEFLANHKRDYSGHARERQLLTSFSIELLIVHSFQRSEAVEVLRECASLFGFELSTRSHQRYVRAAAETIAEVKRRIRRRENVSKLARALME